MSKYLQVSTLLERRILHGDYLLKDFPTDRQLSDEFEVDTRTARKAVALLIKAGLLVRQPNGRPTIGPAVGNIVSVRRLWPRRGGDAASPVATLLAEQVNAEDHDEPTQQVLSSPGLSTPKVALLTIAYPSPHAWRWQQALEKTLNRRGWLFRPVSYVHPDDAVVKDTLAGFDAVFFDLPGIDASDHLIRTIERSNGPIIFLDANLERFGFPSVWLASPQMTHQLLDHLADQGHRKVACLNTQAHHSITNARLEVWRQWSADGRAGKLVDEPVAPGASTIERAYHATLATLDAGGFDADALLCLTAAAAKGAYRALHERGIEVGRDIAVCACDDGAGEAPYFIPSLTSLRDPDPQPYLDVCLDWIARGGQDWQGPLLVQPREVPLFLGESTARFH